MSAGNFDACLAVVLKHEGGYVDHPKDPGGATNLGVTIGTLRAWRGRAVTKAEVRALTVADVKPIYRQNYWNAVGADALLRGVDLAVFDPAVNSGPGRAKQWYATARRGAADSVGLVRGICDARMGFLQRLGNWSSFGKGWSRRVADIRARGEAMARAGQPAAEVAAAATAEATRAATAARKADAQAKTITTAAAGSPAAPAAAGGDWTMIVIVVLAVAIPLAFLALRAWLRSRYEADVSAAYVTLAANPTGAEA